MYFFWCSWRGSLFSLRLLIFQVFVAWMLTFDLICKVVVVKGFLFKFLK